MEKNSEQFWLLPGRGDADVAGLHQEAATTAAAQKTGIMT
jgi:hypothetical protein